MWVLLLLVGSCSDGAASGMIQLSPTCMWGGSLLMLVNPVGWHNLAFAHLHSGAWLLVLRVFASPPGFLHFSTCQEFAGGREWLAGFLVVPGQFAGCRARRQSLTAGCRREIMHDMFRLWCLAESDLLHTKNGYRLVNTGQGLNRVQQVSQDCIGAAELVLCMAVIPSSCQADLQRLHV